MDVEARTQTAGEAAEEAAAFSAVFTPDQEPEVIPEVVPPVEEPAKVDEPIVETPKELTITDLKTMLDEQRELSKKSHDKLAGTVGNLQQRIEAAKVSTSGLSPKAKERLTADFPELASLLFDEGEPEPVAAAPVVAAPIADPRVDDLSRTFERKLLTRDHRDWEQVVISPEFAAWKSTLKPEDSAALDDSWDADFISGKITDFKDHQATQKTNAEKAAQAAEKARKDKERLAGAVTPRGVPRTATAGNGQDDEETAAFKAAFKPIRR